MPSLVTPWTLLWICPIILWYKNCTIEPRMKNLFFYLLTFFRGMTFSFIFKKKTDIKLYICVLNKFSIINLFTFRWAFTQSVKAIIFLTFWLMTWEYSLSVYFYRCQGKIILCNFCGGGACFLFWVSYWSIFIFFCFALSYLRQYFTGIFILL